jgi:hypothetical protein
MLSDGVAIVGRTLAGGFERYRLVSTTIPEKLKFLQINSDQFRLALWSFPEVRCTIWAVSVDVAGEFAG